MLGPRGLTLYQGFEQVAATACDYFRQWTFNEPLVFSAQTHQQLHRVQQLYLKCIRHYVSHYEDYQNLVPLTERIRELLHLLRDLPYRPGTYRTDFIITAEKEIKLIETTCRFALNGFFVSGFFNKLTQQYLEDRPQITRIDDYLPFFDDLMNYFGDFNHVCLLKGVDGRNETKIVVQVFEEAGFPVQIIHLEEIADNLSAFAQAAVIGELNHEEICRQPPAVIEAIITAQPLNDWRTVFLIHDKRFWGLLSHEPFQEAALNETERAELKPFLIPTYIHRLQPELFAQACAEKDAWIIKPSVLGKSEGVYAGCLTERDVWQHQFRPDNLDNLVLQPFMPQRRFPGTIGEATYHDYVAGTLLFFQDHYYGPGLFRASSHPVTNQGDDRKIAPLVTPEAASFPDEFVL